MAKTDLVRAYVAAVERDPSAHPIQWNLGLIPADFRTAGDLYDYTVSPYAADGSALPREASVDSVRWVLFDNVYYRTSGGDFPANARRPIAKKAGFALKYRGHNRGRATDLWRSAVELWGPPAQEGATPARASAPAPEPITPDAPVTSETYEPPQAPEPPTSDGDPAEGLADLAQSIVEHSMRFWRSLEGKLATHDSGFAVFYSPVSDSSRLLIVGANPGGGPEAFDRKKAGLLPAKHDYFAYDYPLARRMRDLFERAGHPEVLRQSVKTNLNFFRSRSTAEWQANSGTVREQAERFCIGKLTEFYRRMKPAMVLAEGMATYDALVELFGAERDTVVVWQGAVRAYAHARLPRTALVGIMHPSGARIGADTWDQMAAALRNDLAAAL